MKTIYTCVFILTFFISCDTASDLSLEQTTNKEQFHRIASELPRNAANPYDTAGWIHNALFESYYENTSNPKNLSAIISRVEALANTNANFISIKTSSYHPVSVERVQYLLDHSKTCVGDVISNSTLSAGAQLSFTTFINSLLTTFNGESTSDDLYQFVSEYEKGILNTTLLTARDKQIILITTSIARHSTYLAKKKPKKNTDPDWIIFVGNVIAAADGAEYGSAEAIVMGLVTGIAQN